MSQTDCTAKVPNDERNWTAIDIFLFSNGQMQSPPRKYHLTAEELEWDRLLNYLALSQFGALNSIIELYTIDGQKVNGPLDLRDGSPYVAVLLPDSFVDSGYEKYLMKASRSWEKRQAKRSTECKTEDLKADCPDACCACPKRVPELLQSDRELTTIKTSDDIVPIESALTRPQRSSTPKCEEDPILDQPPSKNKNSSAPQRPSIIRNYRRRSTGQHPSFAKTAGPQTEINRVSSSTTKTKEVNHNKGLTKIPSPANGRTKLKTKGKIPQIASKRNQLSPPAREPAKANNLKQSSTTLTPNIPKFIEEVPLTNLNSPTDSPNVPKFITEVPLTGQNSPLHPNSNLIRTPIIQDLITDKLITREYAGTLNQITSNEAGRPDMDKTQTLLSVGVDEMVSCHISNNGINQTAQTEKEILTNVISVSCQEIDRMGNELPTNVITVRTEEIAEVIEEKSKNGVSFPYNEVVRMNNEISAIVPYQKVDQMDPKGSENTIDTQQPRQKITQTDPEVSTNLIAMPAQEVFESITKALPEVPSLHTNNVISKIPVEDNYIAIVNKGDGINLNLNIELQKGKTNTNLQGPGSTVLEIRKVSSLTDLFIRSKVQNCNDESVAVEAKSLQSIISPTNDYTRVVIVQCSCCGTHTAIPQFNTMPVYKDENGFYILMPGPSPAVTHSCGCGPNDGTEHKPTTVVNKQSDSSVKQLSITKSDAAYPDVAKDVGVVMTVMHCVTSRINNFHDDDLDLNPLAKRVCNEDHYNGGYCSGILSQQIEKVEPLDEIRSSGAPKNKSNTENSYAQTEWCCILMQVKQHDDNHYSFHLPPLELVKHYSR